MTASIAGLRIGLLTASASRLGGGVFEAVVAQAAMLKVLGAEPHVFALADDCSDSDRDRFGDVPVTHCKVAGPAQVGFSPGMVAELMRAKLDCLHLHGIWMYPSAAAARWGRLSGKPYVVSPHGMLDPWITGRGRWKKAIARAGYERASWQGAWGLHALTRREAADIAVESGRADSIVIPNAGPPAAQAARSFPEPCMAYIGRIHAKKNLSALIGGWTAAGRPAGSQLVIAGWGDDRDVSILRQEVAAAGPSVRFVGPIFGEEKNRLLSSARFAVLPSLSEGLPMAVLEGWACGTPALMTQACNLPEGLERGAALECGMDAAQIACVIEAAFAIEASEWTAMSRAALGLARTNFSREVVAQQWSGAYRAAVSGLALQRTAR